MKVIGIIIDNLTLKGGTERAVINLCNGLLNLYENSYQIKIISLFSSPSELTFFNVNPKVEIIHLAIKANNNFIYKPLWYYHLIQKVKKTFQDNNFNIVIGTTYVHNILLPLISSNKKTKLIGCEHEVYNYPSKLIRFFRKISYKKLNNLVVLNETEKKHYSSIKQVCIIPNSLTISNSSTSNLENKNIIAVGRLTEHKGFDLLIRAMVDVVKKHPDWVLNIYGDGEDKKSLIDLIINNKLEKNIFLKGNAKNINDFYLDSSIFVLSSRWESFGLVIIEAMNAGLPIIAFNCVGPKTLIKDGENGFLVPKYNLNLFSDKICHLIENNNIKIDMAKKAHIYSKQFEENKIIPLWHKLLQHI
nr:glycosyltransferase family 4 protein [uncultured Flavobacterium sp.]